MNSFWAGFEKDAGSKTDRLLSAAKKKPSLLGAAHAAVRKDDLKSQWRGLNPFKETSLTRALERVKKPKGVT